MFRDVRKGLTLGFRGDSGLFFHFFLLSLVIAVAVVLQVSLVQWSLLAFAAAVVFAAEIGARIVQRLTDRETTSEAAIEIQQMSRAAVTLLVLGTTIATLLIFADRARAMFA